MSVSNICLLCLQHSDELFEIFGKRGIELNAGTTLKVHFWFEVSESDEESICEQCWWTVQNFHDFYNSVKINHQFNSIFDANSVIVDANEYNEIDFKGELIDNIKNEPSIDIEDDIDVHCSSDIPETLPKSPHRPDDSESCMQPKLNQAADSPTVKQRKPKKTSVSPSAVTTKKYKTDIHTTLLSTYFNMSCDLCDAQLLSYRHTRKHYKEVHNIQGYLICCSKKFVPLALMLQHCQWHMNPDLFKCDHCPKTFDVKGGLQKHMKCCHTTANEEVFSCSDCDKLFIKQCYLTAHMKKKHGLELTKKDKQINRRQYKKIRTPQHHSNICEVCATPFKSVHAFKIHYMNCHTNISHEVQCDICGKWLKHKGRLRKHFDWHNRKAETCALCGRSASSREALQAHIRRVHREASLECVICGKMFKGKKVLKDHMAIHYGITDLYKCTFCTKTFRNNGNMYAHRKRVHPIELEKKKASQNSFTPAKKM